MSTGEKAKPRDLQERRLWCAVISSAQQADDTRFFKSEWFEEIAGWLGLPAEQIRNKVLAEAR